jgi:ferredoxin
MNISTFVFSPTTTTERIVKSITSQFPESRITHTDWTHSDNCKLPAETDLVILGVPVYSGLAPTTVLDRINQLQGSGTPIVLLTVYGNRGADTASRELYEITSSHGFTPIAAAEFIGEHSFSTPVYPIAAGRPDEKDLDIAEKFGKKIKLLLKNPIISLSSEDFDQSPHRERKPLQVEPPVKDLERCTNCGACEPVCPQNIWPLGNATTKGECIGCCACIKVCEFEALIPQEVIQGYSIKLNQLCQTRKEPKLIFATEV